MKNLLRGSILMVAAISTLWLSSCNEDEGDNGEPVIADQEFTVQETAINGTSLGAIQATDPDNDDLTFEIFSGNERGAFAININSGELTVADITAIDFTTSDPFVLTVDASDGKLTSSAEITIVVVQSNTAPSIEDQTFTIDENAMAGEIGQVVATDAQTSNLQYFVTNGNEEGIFSLTAGGILHLTKAEMIDYEKTEKYTLTIQVSDGQLTAQAEVTVHVNNIADGGTIEVLGETFTLIDGHVADYGQWGPHYNLDFITTDGELVWSNEYEDYISEKWNIVVYSELLSPGTTFEDGLYQYAHEDTPSDQLENLQYFNYSLIAIDGNDNNEFFQTPDDMEKDKYYVVTGGTVSVVTKQAFYTLSYDISVAEYDLNTDETGESFDVSFTYTGRYKYTDESNRPGGRKMAKGIAKKLPL